MAGKRRTLLLACVAAWSFGSSALAQMGGVSSSAGETSTNGLQTLKLTGPVGALQQSIPMDINENPYPTNGLTGTSYNTGYGANQAITGGITPLNVQPPPAAPQIGQAALKLLSDDKSEANPKNGATKSTTDATKHDDLKPGQTFSGNGVAVAANEIIVDDKTVTLIGDDLPSAGAVCQSPQWVTWSCGSEATQYLQSLLDQGQVSCTTVTAGEIPAAICQIGFDDLATGANQWPARGVAQYKQNK